MKSAITLTPRHVKLTNRTGVEVRRTLPHKELRTIGAWCFIDHFGPTSDEDAMSVAAHPHTGLQTASWLIAGEVEHRDSLGSIQLIRPGELNLMTAGSGIAHSELSINESQPFHGVQLWIVLPDAHRHQDSHFEHHDDLPVVRQDNLVAKVFAGSFLGVTSPANYYSPLVGAEISITSDVQIPLVLEFEYGILVVSRTIRVNGELVEVGSLHYLPAGNESVSLSGEGQVMFLGGEPFAEDIVMWWNFIGRSHEEIIEMKSAWEQRVGGFKEFDDRIGGFIPAPDLPNVRLTARSNPK